MDGFIRIAVVGAPGSGKTTGMPVLARHAKAMGFEVRRVPEAATMALKLMRPADPRKLGEAGVVELQRAVFRLQVAMEDAARVWPVKKGKGCVMFCDRGVLDGEVYLGKKVWKRVLEEEGAGYAGLMKRYDAVIHLGTAAGLATGRVYRAVGVRLEDRAFALELEERARAIWGRHPGYAYVPASERVEEKWAGMVEAFGGVVG
jgi:hypothetical protein